MLSTIPSNKVTLSVIYTMTMHRQVYSGDSAVESVSSKVICNRTYAQLRTSTTQSLCYMTKYVIYFTYLIHYPLVTWKHRGQRTAKMIKVFSHFICIYDRLLLSVRQVVSDLNFCFALTIYIQAKCRNLISIWWHNCKLITFQTKDFVEYNLESWWKEKCEYNIYHGQICSWNHGNGRALSYVQSFIHKRYPS